MALNAADIEVFNKVASTLSFTTAAERLGLSRSAVSKRISRLEADTGVALFRRAPRRISLTSAGERFYAHTAKLDEILMLATESVNNLSSAPAGRLTVTLPTTLGASLLPLLLTDFRNAWPGIELAVHTDDQYLDIIESGIDVAIRIAKSLPDSSLIARKLAESPDILVASPSYIDKYGRPRNASELRTHHCLTLMRRDTAWRLVTHSGHVRIVPRHVTTFNNELSIVLAACLGAGIARVPEFAVTDHPNGASDIRLNGAT